MAELNISPIRRRADLVAEVLYSGVPLVAALGAIVFQVSSTGVVRFLVFMLFAGSVSLVIRRIRMEWKEGKLAGIAVVIGFLGWYAIPPCINLLSEGKPIGEFIPGPMNQGTTLWALIYLSGFLTSWVLVSGFFSRFRFFQPAVSFVSYNTDPLRLIWMAIACCIVGLIPYVLSGLDLFDVIALIFQGRMAEKPWLHWENLGDFRSALLFISQSAMAAGVSVLWLMTLERKFTSPKRVSIGIVALTFSVLIFFDQGTRSTMAFMILPVVLINMFHSWKYNRVHFAIVSSLLGVIFLVLLQLQLYYRTIGSGGDLPRLLLLKWITLEDTTDLFSETAFAITLTPSLHDYFKESSLYHFLVSPIPRFIWPSKPASQVVWFYSLHRWGIDIYEGAGNVFPGVVGQSYMSWGWCGPIFLGGSLGWLSSRVDDFLARASRNSDPYQRAAGILMSVWILLSFRVLSPGYLYPIVLVFMMIIFCSAKNTSSRGPSRVLIR